MTTFQSESTTAVSTGPADTAETLFVDGPTARFAYRRFGKPAAIPLVLAMRFRGTLDHWDPALLDLLAQQREIIVFDNLGTGASTGPLPRSIHDMAAGLIEFVQALELRTVDLFGWSIGGIVTQAAALERPDLVRRLIVAASTPGAVPDQPAPGRRYGTRQPTHTTTTRTSFPSSSPTPTPAAAAASNHCDASTADSSNPHTRKSDPEPGRLSWQRSEASKASRTSSTDCGCRYSWPTARKTS
jgi:pimeloyl-ACP methyl ester carboxylesterase